MPHSAALQPVAVLRAATLQQTMHQVCQMVVYLGATAVFTSIVKYEAAQLIRLSHVESVLKARTPLMTGEQC